LASTAATTASPNQISYSAVWGSPQITPRMQPVLFARQFLGRGLSEQQFRQLLQEMCFTDSRPWMPVQRVAGPVRTQWTSPAPQKSPQ
jgi:hypothetical protein